MLDTLPIHSPNRTRYFRRPSHGGKIHPRRGVA